MDTVDTKDLDVLAEHALAQANAIVIRNDDEYTTAGAAVKIVKANINTIKEFFKPHKAAAKLPHTKLCDDEKSRLVGLEATLGIINGKLNTYETDRAAKAAEIQAGLDKQAAQQAEEQALRDAEEAERIGDTVKAEELISEPPPPPMKTLVAPLPKIAGRSKRPKYTPTLVSLQELVLATADEIRELEDSTREPALVFFLTADMVAIGAAARGSKGKIKIPGVRIEDGSTAVQRV